MLQTLSQEGQIDKIKAKLRSEVIRVLEKEKKESFGGASKYLKKSELATTITKKVVSNDDGLVCAEIIREFMQFYKMDHSLHVFVPEMSLSEDFPKSRQEIEREIGLTDRDQSKPLLLKLVELIKFGGISQPTQKQPDSAGKAPGFQGTPHSDHLNGASPEMSSPDPSTKKENQRRSKRENKKAITKGKLGAKVGAVSESSSEKKQPLRPLKNQSNQ